MDRTKRLKPKKGYTDEYWEERGKQFLKLMFEEQNLRSSNTDTNESNAIWYTINQQKEQKASLYSRVSKVELYRI